MQKPVQSISSPLSTAELGTQLEHITGTHYYQTGVNQQIGYLNRDKIKFILQDLAVLINLAKGSFRA